MLSSLYFYAYFNYSYLIIIIMSILFNYFIGEIIHKKTNLKKIFLLIGVLFNVFVLIYFKYVDFFITNANLIFQYKLPLQNILLPLGISFFTFQQLSFVIDCYYEKSEKYDFLSYCLFVTFFPQLIAGPIVLPNEMLPQFQNDDSKSIVFSNLNKGFYIFSIGLAKKILIADSIAPLANAGFDKMNSLTFLEGWVTSLSYTMQLYFDFSGYCDMAMGVALMFNIVLPCNFNSPYMSTNIQEFWKKWHMTLGRFFTNYLYIPLGGNRKGELRTFTNLMIVFLASGMWHGAGWNFIIWGLLHGTSILIHRIWKSHEKKLHPLLGWLITFNLVNFLWIFFRAKNINGAIKIIKAMLDFSTFDELITNNYISNSNLYFDKNLTFIVLITSIIISTSYRKNSYYKLVNLKYKNIVIIEKGFYFVTSLLLLNRIAEFLYFNF